MHVFIVQPNLMSYGGAVAAVAQLSDHLQKYEIVNIFHVVPVGLYPTKEQGFIGSFHNLVRR